MGKTRTFRVAFLTMENVQIPASMQRKLLVKYLSMLLLHIALMKEGLYLRPKVLVVDISSHQGSGFTTRLRIIHIMSAEHF